MWYSIKQPHATEVAEPLTTSTVIDKETQSINIHLMQSKTFIGPIANLNHPSLRASPGACRPEHRKYHRASFNLLCRVTDITLLLDLAGRGPRPLDAQHICSSRRQRSCPALHAVQMLCKVANVKAPFMFKGWIACAIMENQMLLKLDR